MKYLMYVMLISATMAVGSALPGAYAGSCHADATAIKTDAKELRGEGKRIPIDKDHYFIYEFVKKPALGTVIFRIQVFGPGGKQATPFRIYGDYGMPSMRGAHDSGRVEFKTNKKGDYLIPVNIVMPGDWDMTITVEKEGKQIFKGLVKFDV